jgi:hypothetical protein
MKTSIVLMCAIGVTVLAVGTSVVTIGYVLSNQHILNQKLILAENKIFLSDKSNQLLEEEVNDLQYSISTAKTYEEGYRDALVRLNNPKMGTFDEGYEAAKTVYGKGAYTDGYHAAIEQLSYASNNVELKECPLGKSPSKE